MGLFLFYREGRRLGRRLELVLVLFSLLLLFVSSFVCACRCCRFWLCWLLERSMLSQTCPFFRTARKECVLCVCSALVLSWFNLSCSFEKKKLQNTFCVCGISCVGEVVRGVFWFVFVVGRETKCVYTKNITLGFFLVCQSKKRIH